MTLATAFRLVLACSMALIVIHFARLALANTWTFTRGVRTAVLSALLMIAATVANIQSLQSPISQVVMILCFHQALLLVLAAFKQVSGNERYDVTRDKFYLTVSGLSLINALVALTNWNNSGSFIDNEAYIPTINYYLAQYMCYGIALVVSVKSILYISAALNDGIIPLGYALRKKVYAFAMTIAGFCWLLILVNLTLAIVIGNRYQHELNEIYHMGKVVVGILMVLCIIPSPINPSSMYERYRSFLIHFLHRSMIRISSTHHVATSPLTDHDALIEISDTRDLIWSHIQHSEYITPDAEAKQLHKLLREKTHLEKSGHGSRPQHVYDDLTYNLLVAKHLIKIRMLSYLPFTWKRGA